MDTVTLVIAVLAGLSMFLLILAMLNSTQSVASTPWRQACERMMRWSVRERYARKLCLANMADWHVTDLWLLRLLVALLTVVLVLLTSLPWFWSLLGAMFGWWIVGFWLAQRIKQQQHLLTAQLPAFLDLLSMSLSAGMNLQTGVQLVLSVQGKSALAALWRTWLLQVRSGTGRVQAFKQMLERVEDPALRRICVALIQAEQAGSGMAASLQVHSQQLRYERLMQAEKQALKAPVKMLLPLVVCFFPSTFLVLGFSIYINLGDMF